MLPVWITDSVTPDLSRAVHYTLLWGLEGVVLRTVGGSGNRVPFVNEQQLRARLADAELPIVAVDPGLFEGSVDNKAVWLNDLMILSDVANFCNRLGCETIITGALAGTENEFDVATTANVLSQAARIAHRAGTALALRNDASTGCASGERLADLVAAVGHANVSAAWSPADAMQAGNDPAVGLEALLDRGRLAMVFVRDGETEASGWVDRTPGQGGVGWEGQFRKLADAGFTGPLCLDVRGDSPAKRGLAQASALHEQIKAARAPA